jgi:hypothetical protein
MSAFGGKADIGKLFTAYLKVHAGHAGRPRDLYISFQLYRASALGLAFAPAFFKPRLTAGIDPA